MWPRKKDPGEPGTVGTDYSNSAGRIWSICSTRWTQVCLWLCLLLCLLHRMLPEEGHSEPGQDKGLEAAKLYPRAETEGAVRGGLDTGTNYCPGGSHMFHRVKAGEKEAEAEAARVKAEEEAAEAKAATEAAAKSDAEAEAARLQAKKEAKEAEAVEVARMKDEAEAAPDEEARLKAEAESTAAEEERLREAAEDEAAEEEQDLKHKYPDEGIRPTREETVDSNALILEDGAVQAGEEKKPLECNICGKRFINILALEEHMKIHVKPEDTYNFHICRQDFKQVLGLTEHDKCGDYTCPHCNRFHREI